MKKGDKVKVIGGRNEVGQPTLIDKNGVIEGLGTKYVVKGKETREVFVNFLYWGTHLFNDYHLKKI